MLKTEGKGRFVGFGLHIWNPFGGWWGEGDEKFFVDGEKFPSTYGTGSEDYFGYGWGCYDPFQRPFHTQSRVDGAHEFHIHNARWHISDQIPFHTSFFGTIEKYYSNKKPCLFAGTAFWYLNPDGKDPYPTDLPLEERTGYFGYGEELKTFDTLVPPQTIMEGEIAGPLEAEPTQEDFDTLEYRELTKNKRQDSFNYFGVHFRDKKTPAGNGYYALKFKLNAVKPCNVLFKFNPVRVYRNMEKIETTHDGTYSTIPLTQGENNMVCILQSKHAYMKLFMLDESKGLAP